MKEKESPIQRKLINVIMISCGAVTLLTCIAFFAYEFITFRQTTLRQLSTLGEIISANSTAAIAFNDPADANEVLSALKAEKQIEAACLYDKSGVLFSKYPPDLPDTAFPSTPENVGYRFEKSNVIGFQPVIQANQRLGTLYIRSNIQALYDRFEFYSLIVLLIIAGAFIITYILSKGLQQRVSKPILALVETAKIISSQQDYSVRAKKVSDDELGLLTDAFNQMLTRIEKQTVDLSESEERLRAVLDSSITAVIVMDVHGVIIDWNERAEKMFGWKRHEALNRDLADTIIPHNLREAHRSGLKHFLATGRGSVFNRLIEIVALHRNGSEFSIELAVSRLKTNDVVTFCGFITDITERKRAEEEIKLFSQKLEQMVADRTKELELVNKELESFSYSVSHDLRAPLRAIHGYVNIFAEEYANKFDDEAKRLTNIIMSNTQKMGRLIDDLLAFSQLGRKELVKTQTSMTQMVKSICEEQKRSETDRSIEFTIHELPFAFVDTVTIRQVWVNLISNAVKYTRHKPHATIEIGANEEGDYQVYYVRDNGAGFDMLYYDKLFGVFQRLHSQKEFEGTGVGLAIVQRIVLRHGGKVWAEAEPNVGATFYFSLQQYVE
ncbi:PAS domain S-box protein [Chryseolinea sp. H1M3-3]|uniref:PAS domain S-box protein n=1 Tax=Chryseolinea sp. H1M3-3 TaxID=3034144 RepID=UPI0023EC1AFD|nr:PAS domain S-box protein [Chryseolinea sp. H1M3-3]